MRIWSGPGANAWKHGEHSGGKLTPEYQAFHAAKKRCTTDERARHFKWYGKRGIKFLFASFQQFLESVGRKPSPKHWLDRINNDGNYEPGNVRWTTPCESQRNRRSINEKMRMICKTKVRNNLGRFS